MSGKPDAVRSLCAVPWVLLRLAVGKCIVVMKNSAFFPKESALFVIEVSPELHAGPGPSVNGFSFVKRKIN